MARDAGELVLPIPLPELREILRRYGVVETYVFGSYARGTARPDSDLDLLVTLGPDADPWEFLSLADELERRLPAGADVVTNINRHFWLYIEPDLVRIL
ncbi:nucleotidyltransferase family protein [Rhodococcus sp. W8901]|uniref:nucleotidyltransferase family protein n=1 Tax=Rhodococcus sp. W8901 TaxID=2742603 RepID=UPI0015827FD9|nr:nucleotidyltransferase domain-containing protein [Rhodococcus sp. W8901]QKT12161.1 nucleotidyltransferase domain-containing protein [Rhodococcus sp. W8901]